MISVIDLSTSIRGFYERSAVEQILLIAWHLETKENVSCFDAELMRRCFRELGIVPPDMSVYLPRLTAKKIPQLLRSKAGYRLANVTKRELNTRFGGDPRKVVVSKILSDLPASVPDIAERDFLLEALNCYKVGAYRATITMTWNLTFDHLVRWIFSDPIRVAAFNQSIATKYPKKNLTVTSLQDVDVLRESEIIEIYRAAKLLDKNTTQILQDKLSRRNMAAHPSRVAITQHQADDVITDLVHNVVLKLV